MVSLCTKALWYLLCYSKSVCFWTRSYIEVEYLFVLMPTWCYFDMFCNTSWYLIMLTLQFGSFSWRLTSVFLVWCILQSTVSSVSLVAQMVKGLPAIWETWARSLGWKDSLEKEMATHSSTLAWKIPWTEEPGRLQSMGLHRIGPD